jgi:hypothetical protein
MASGLQDDSADLLNTLSTSLQSAFTPDEVSMATGKEVCAEALLKVASLAGKGYLKGVESASQAVANLISTYTVLNNASNGNSTQYPIDKAVSYCRQTITA